jgi:hypothetical protein
MFFVLGENVEEYAGVFFRSGVLVDRVLSACCFGVALLDGLRSSTYSHFLANLANEYFPAPGS